MAMMIMKNTTSMMITKWLMSTITHTNIEHLTIGNDL